MSEMEESNTEEENNSESSENKTTADVTLSRKRKAVYEHNSDFTLVFKDGKSIVINGNMLGFHSQHFMDIVYREPPENNVEITDFDSDTFKLFLDCLFDLKDYSVLDALLIYPVAYEFKVEKSLRKCVKVLKPKIMNENVCLTLNLACLYECGELILDVIHFFEKDVNIVNVLENKNYCYLLEPLPLLKLIEKIEMDSCLWKIVFEWGENHLKKNNSLILWEDVTVFLLENNILSNFSLSNLESIQSIFDFHEIVTKKTFLTLDQITQHWRNNLMESGEKLPKKSLWVEIKKGESFKETLTFKQILSFNRFTVRNGLILQIWLNSIRSKNDKDDGDCDFLNYTVNYNGRTNDFKWSSIIFKTSSTFKFTEKINGRSCTKHGNKIDINVDYVLDIKSVDITYNFSCDCRILKTSLNDNFKTNDDNLYFTNDINCNPKEYSIFSPFATSILKVLKSNNYYL